MKLFIWDFHGVIEKDNEKAVVDVTNDVLASLGYSERLTLELCNQLYGKKWFEFIQKILPNETPEKCFDIQDLCFNHSIGNPHIIAKHIQPTAHVHNVLQIIAESDHDQILVSNTDPASLIKFMASVDIAKYFPEGKVFAINAHRKDCNNSKASIVKEYIKNNNFDNVITIGDSPIDMELGNIRYLYSHPEKSFRVCESDYKINDLREVLKEI